MPRTHPIDKLEILGRLEKSPEQALEFHTESKSQIKFFVKPPNWDSPGDSIELLACQNERELTGMIKLQEEMLDGNSRQEAINKSRIDELRKLQTNLRARFIQANNFLKDCDDKKKAAELKVSEEKQLHVKLRADIKEYKESIAALTDFRNALKDTVEQFEPYETVIDAAIDASPIWTSVKDCTDRCDALMMAQVEIVEMKKVKAVQIDEMRQNIQSLTNEAMLTVLGLKNQLAELDRGYSAARMMCLKWEYIMGNIKDVLINQQLQKKQIIDGLQYMYRSLCKRRGIDANLRSTDVEEMLNIIRDEIIILRAVLNECTAKKTIHHKHRIKPNS